MRKRYNGYVPVTFERGYFVILMLFPRYLHTNKSIRQDMYRKTVITTINLLTSFNTLMLGRGKDGGKDANFPSISIYSWKLIALIYLTNDQYIRTGTDCVVHHPQNVHRTSPARCMSRYCLYVALCWTLRLPAVTWCVHLVLVTWPPYCNVNVM